MSAPPDIINAIRDVEAADRALKAVIAAPGVSLSSQRAKDARKKLKEAKARHKEVKAKFDAYIAEEKRQTDAWIKNVDESLAKAKKAKTKKGGRRGSRRTRRSK